MTQTRPDPSSLPMFIPPPGGTDYLLVATGVFLIVFILAVGIIYLHLHALPDHIAHKSQKIQYEVVCLLGLLAMFTHVQAFWIAGLILALIDIPDFSGPLNRIARAIHYLSMGKSQVRAGRVANREINERH
ncbi:MAG: hypothetical protein U1E62_22005 [Alsobacter sp.]